MVFLYYSNLVRENISPTRDNTTVQTTACVERQTVQLSTAFYILIKQTGIYGGVTKIQNIQKEIKLYHQKM